MKFPDFLNGKKHRIWDAILAESPGIVQIYLGLSSFEPAANPLMPIKCIQPEVSMSHCSELSVLHIPKLISALNICEVLSREICAADARSGNPLQKGRQFEQKLLPECTNK